MSSEHNVMRDVQWNTKMKGLSDYIASFYYNRDLEIVFGHTALRRVDLGQDA